MPVAVPDQIGEHRLVDVVELVDIEAPGTGLVLPQLRQQPGRLRSVGQPVEGQAGFPWREADGGRIALSPARVLVGVSAEADNRRAPHLRRLPGDLFHQCPQPQPVPVPDGMFDGGEEVPDRRAGCRGLVFGFDPGLVHSHAGSVADRGGLVSRTGAGDSLRQ